MNDIVTILIPCRNEVNFIEKTIDDIFLSDYPEDKIEVIVADGGSNDGTLEKLAEIKKRYKNVIVINNEKKITPVAFNIGLANASGDYFMTLGARQIMDKNYIKECLAVLLNNDNIVCCGGISKTINVNEKGKNIAKAMSSRFGVGLGNFRALSKPQYVDTVGAPLYKKWIFEKLGWFDEDLVRNQDDEFNYRVIKAGYKIFMTDKADVYYISRDNHLNLFKQYFQYGYWKVFVNKKHKNITTLRQIVPALFIVLIIVACLLAFVNTLFLFCAISLMLFYFLVMAIISAKMSNGINSMRQILLAFFCLHFGYGFGYLKGIYDFLIFNKAPALNAKKLTR